MERVLQQPMMLHEESGLRAQATKIRSETDGQHRALLFATLLRNLMVIKLDHVIRACSASDTRSLDADVESIQHALKVLYGWNALLEDDHDIFAWMLHSDIAMAQRCGPAPALVSLMPTEGGSRDRISHNMMPSQPASSATYTYRNLGRRSRCLTSPTTVASSTSDVCWNSPLTV